MLSAWQSPSAYYAGLSIKRSTRTFAKETKKAKIAHTYQNFVVPAMMQWAEEQGHAFPVWLNREVMGRSTLNGECVVFHVERAPFSPCEYRVVEIVVLTRCVTCLGATAVVTAA